NIAQPNPSQHTPIHPTRQETDMYVTPDQITTYGKTGVETLINLARSNFAVYEKLAALNFTATKGAFEDGVNHTRALLNARDVQEYVNLNSAAAQPAIEKLIAYS